MSNPDQNTNTSNPLQSQESSPDVLYEETKAMSDGLRSAFKAMRGMQLAENDLYHKEKWQRRKDRRIIECSRNAVQPGRGKFVFIITRPTFEQIIQYIEESGGYFAQEVVRILMAMYYDGADFTETGPEVTRKTVTRQLRAAFKGLDIFIGDWKQPGIWTVKISHKLLKDAEEAELDLKNWFLVV